MDVLIYGQKKTLRNSPKGFLRVCLCKTATASGDLPPPHSPQRPLPPAWPLQTGTHSPQLEQIRLLLRRIVCGWKACLLWLGSRLVFRTLLHYSNKGQPIFCVYRVKFCSLCSSVAKTACCCLITNNIIWVIVRIGSNSYWTILPSCSKVGRWSVRE